MHLPRRLTLLIVLMATILTAAPPTRADESPPGDAPPGGALPGDALPGDALPGDTAPTDGATVIATDPPIETKSTINGMTVGFANENNKTTIWLRICSDAPNFQLRSENVGQWITQVFHRTLRANGCSPGAGANEWWRMVFNIDPNTGEVFRIYGYASDAVLSDAAFMQRASRTDCRVTGLARGTCTPASPAPVSVPLVDINDPPSGATLQGNALVRGWAIDGGSWSGPGVSDVHVRLNGAFIAAASYGIARGDVASAYGDSRFTNSGYQLTFDTRAFPNGPATLQVSYRSALTGAWHAMERAVTVSNAVAPPPDRTPPDGSITAPAEGSAAIGSVVVRANASDNPGGSGVERVEFFVAYDHRWHPLAVDTAAPYEATWNIPATLRSQTVMLTIHVVDRAGNRRIDPGGYRRISYTASQQPTDVVGIVRENWIPSHRNAYLNQNALGVSVIRHYKVNGTRTALTSQYVDLNHPGNIKCSAASVAMALAINGYIGRDFNSMKTTANAVYPNVLDYLTFWQNNQRYYRVGSQGEGVLSAFIGRQTRQLRDYGASGAQHIDGSLPVNQRWERLKQEINAGRPVILGVNTTSAGHLIVVVGWREVNGVRKIIVNDPFGRWLGDSGRPEDRTRYDRNDFDNPNSAKGRWVEYHFDRVGPGWMITTGPVRAQAMIATAEDPEVPATPPGEPSFDEPESIVEFEGTAVVEELPPLYLPMVGGS